MISRILGHNGLEPLLERISSIVDHRYHRLEHPPATRKSTEQLDSADIGSTAAAKLYIDCE